MKLVTVDFYMKICQENPNLVKVGQKCQALTWRPKYMLLLCNSQCSCIFDHAMQLNNIWRMHCCISSSTMVTQTYHNVMLYVYCIFCFHTNGSKQMGNITVCIIFQWHLHIKFLNTQAFQRKTMVIIWCGYWKKEQYIDKTNVKMMCLQFWELM